VRDLAVADRVSANNKDLLVYGPRIKELAASRNRIVAGDGSFKLRIRGDNFRSGATVELNGAALSPGLIVALERTVISVRVPKSFTQDAGKLAVAVRNPEGGVSDPAVIDVRAP